MSNVVIYRASELGSCTRSLVANRLGYDRKSPPEATQRRMDEGKLHERDVIERLIEEGWEFPTVGVSDGERVRVGKQEFLIEEGQITVWLQVSAYVWVKGHMDGAGYPPEHWPRRIPVNLEVKSMSKDEFAKYKEKRLDQPSNFLIQRYLWQFSAYGHGTGFPTLLVVKDRNSGEIMRDVIEPPALPYTATQIKMRVLGVEGLVRLGQLPEFCDRLQFPCPFYYLNCKTEDDTGGVVSVEDSVLASACEAYKGHSANFYKYKRLMEEARDQIHDLLGGKEKVKAGEFESVEVGDWEVRRTPYTNEVWNATRAKEDGVDLEQYRETVTTYYTKINRKKGSE